MILKVDSGNSKKLRLWKICQVMTNFANAVFLCSCSSFAGVGESLRRTRSLGRGRVLEHNACDHNPAQFAYWHFLLAHRSTKCAAIKPKCFESLNSVLGVRERVNISHFANFYEPQEDIFILTLKFYALR